MILDSIKNTQHVENLHPLFKKAFDLLGVEIIGWKPGSELQEESAPYNEEKDIAFYIDQPTAYTRIYPGQFAIYFPEDGHAPGIGQGNIRKVIVKVQVEP